MYTYILYPSRCYIAFFLYISGMDFVLLLLVKIALQITHLLICPGVNKQHPDIIRPT